MSMTRFKNLGLCVAGGLLTSLFSTTAFATSIAFGVANINGQAVVTATSISFENNVSVANAYNAGSGTGSFAGLMNGGGTMSTGWLQSLSGAPGPVNLVDYATFESTIGLIQFDMTFLFPGTGTAAPCLVVTNAPGATCTPTGSPFTLTQEATGVTVTLAESGNFYIGTSASGTSPGSGLFTAQISVPGQINAVLLALEGGTLGAQTYSASFTAGVPEPGTILMFLAGLGMIAVGKKRNKAAR